MLSISRRNLRRRGEFGSAKSSQSMQGKHGPNPQNKGQIKYVHSQDNQSKPQHRKCNEKSNKDTRKWCEYHKIPWKNTKECRFKQSLVVELKASESKEDSDSKSNLEGGK
jgi:hypothetical protein